MEISTIIFFLNTFMQGQRDLSLYSDLVGEFNNGKIKKSIEKVVKSYNKHNIEFG